MKNLIKKLVYKIPNFQKLYFSFKKKFLYDNPEFVGWGMTTHSIPPWRDQINSSFLKQFDKVEKNCKNLLLKILTPKFENNDKQIIISEESIISFMEFRFNCSSCL